MPEPTGPASRPAIPAATKRRVKVEAGHRCAVCGETNSLEIAHIRTWARSRDHSPENLICLCANCHTRADNEKWGEKDLRLYKENPWVKHGSSRRDIPTSELRDVHARDFHGSVVATGDNVTIRTAAAGSDLTPVRTADELLHTKKLELELEMPRGGQAKFVYLLRRFESLETSDLLRRYRNGDRNAWADVQIAKEVVSELKDQLGAGSRSTGIRKRLAALVREIGLIEQGG